MGLLYLLVESGRSESTSGRNFLCAPIHEWRGPKKCRRPRGARLTPAPVCVTFCNVTMFSASKAPRKPLSELEHQIMRVLWTRGAASSEQVRTALAVRRPLKDSTVRTVLRRLQEKGYVQYKVDGRTYIYTVVEAPRNVAVRAVRQIIDRFCGGSVEQLLVGMVENEVLDRRELRQLAQKLASRKAAKGERT